MVWLFLVRFGWFGCVWVWVGLSHGQVTVRSRSFHGQFKFISHSGHVEATVTVRSRSRSDHGHFNVTVTVRYGHIQVTVLFG